MKKFWSVLLVALLVISFTACDSPTNPKPASVSLEEARSIMGQYGHFFTVIINEIAEEPEQTVPGVVVEITDDSLIINFSSYSFEDITVDGRLVFTIIQEDNYYTSTMLGTFTFYAESRYTIAINIVTLIEFGEEYEVIDASQTATVVINGTEFDLADLLPLPE